MPNFSSFRLEKTEICESLSVLRKYLTPNVEFLDLYLKTNSRVKRFQLISVVMTFRKRNMKTNKD